MKIDKLPILSVVTGWALSGIAAYSAINLIREDQWQEVSVDYSRFWTSTSRTTALFSAIEGDPRTGRKPFDLSIWSRGRHERYDTAHSSVN